MILIKSYEKNKIDFMSCSFEKQLRRADTLKLVIPVVITSSF